MKSFFVRLALLLYISGAFIMLSSAQNDGGGKNGNSSNSTGTDNGNNTTSNTNNTNNSNGGNNGSSNSTSTTTTVTVTQPYEGAVLVAGQLTNITWEASDVSSNSPNINLDILSGQGNNSRKLDNIKSGLSLSSKIFTWTIDRQFGNGSYTIRLYSDDTPPSINAYSPLFKIVNYDPLPSGATGGSTPPPTGTSGNGSGSSGGSGGNVLDSAAGRYIPSSLFVFWAIVTGIFFVL